MANGVVKWFNNAKGYGFVTPDDGENDIFVHFSAVEMDGYKTLKEGQRVHFEVHEGPKGLHAQNLTCELDGDAVSEEPLDEQAPEMIYEPA